MILVPNQGQLSLREITNSFSACYGEEYDWPVSSRWIGTIIRKRLRINTQNPLFGGVTSAEYFALEWRVMHFRCLAPIELDAHGMLGRECRQNCFQYFKVDGHALEMITGDRMWCPYCGFHGNRDRFLTPGQISYLKSFLMKKLIEGPLGQQLKRLERRPDPNALISLGIRVVLPNINLRKNVEQAVERRLKCEACSRGYAVFGTSAWCPFCGPRPPYQVFFENLVTIRQFLNIESIVAGNPVALDQLRQMALPQRLAEKALDMTVTAFESYCKGRFIDRIAQKRSVTPLQLQKDLGNVFQNLQRGTDLLKQEFTVGYDDILTHQEIQRLSTAFQKRHVLIHNAGIIDERYCTMTGEPPARIGQRAIAHRAEVTGILLLLEKLVKFLDSTIP